MKLTPREIATLADSPDLGSLQKLNVSNKGIDSIMGLDACKSLTRLDASANNLTDVHAIAAASTLRWLSVAKNQITSLEPLKDLENLEILNAAHNKLQGKISMGKFRSLKALILNDNENITTVGGLEKLKNLDALVLSHNAIESLGGWLNGCTALQKLSFSYNPLNELASSLSTCPNLQELRLNHCHLTELPESLASNARLLTLEVGSNKIADFESLEVLRKLPLLRQLTLKGCPVATLPGYQEKILKLAPKLQILDNKRLDGGKKKRDREQLAAWAPARAASDANATPVAPRAVPIPIMHKEVVVDAEKKKEKDVYVERKVKKQKKEKPKEKEVKETAPKATKAPSKKVKASTPAPQHANDDNDDDALDPSAFVSTSLATKKANNTSNGKATKQHTGVVKVEKLKKKKTGDGGGEPARGVDALKALLTAKPTPSTLPGGGGCSAGADDAIAGWD